jgi:inosine-uridine nucleoside N-ribohydrolase
MSLKPFIIDCDTGRDDALAFWCATALNLPLAGAVASYGNVVMTQVLDNTARVLSLAGRDDVPLLAGASRPSRRHAGYEQIVLPRQRKSGNGLSNINLPRSTRMLPEYTGPEGLAKQVAEIAAKTGPLDYIITGPATNCAVICAALAGRMRDTVARVTMMGGKFGLWSTLPGADFNIVADPYAARALIEKGVEFRFVPMDTTWPIVLTLPEVQALVPQNSVASAAQEIMVAHCRYFAPEPVFRFHDPAVLMAALAPEGFANVSVDIVLDEKSAEFGRLVEKDDGFPVQIYRTSDKMRQEFLGRMLAALGLARAARS